MEMRHGLFTDVNYHLILTLGAWIFLFPLQLPPFPLLFLL